MSIKSLISMKFLLIKLFFLNCELSIKILEFISKFLTLNLLLILNEKSLLDSKFVFIKSS